jgi:hypothetical protein
MIDPKHKVEAGLFVPDGKVIELDERQPFARRVAAAKAAEPQEPVVEEPSVAEAVAKISVKRTAAEALIQELVQVFQSDDSLDRLRYNRQKEEVARVLNVTQMDVHRAVMKEVEKEKKKETKVELSQAHKTIALFCDDRMTPWSDPADGTAYASIRVNGWMENYRIGSGEFENWVRAEYGARHWKEIDGKCIPMPISSQALHEGIATMKALALGARQKHTPSVRVGGSKDEVWLDLGGTNWLLIKATPQGWKQYHGTEPGAVFIRKPGMLELPEPVGGGKIGDFRWLFNMSDEDFVLQVGWLLGTLQPWGPYPPDMITGVSGAAKTSLCWVLQELIDPNGAQLIPLSTPDNIYVNAFNRYVLGFDNISSLTIEQSDVLCRIATGTGYAKRMLRTDADQFMMRIRRPILLNGIPADLANRSDLARRAIVSELPEMDDSVALGEGEFWEMFCDARPRLLGVLLDGVVGALQNFRGVNLKPYPQLRMKDFARWAEAGCRALGFKENEFLKAYAGNQERALRIIFKQDLVAQAVALLMDQQERWAGNTKPLYEALKKAIVKAKQTAMLEDRRWPGNDTWLGRDLRRSATVLRKVANIKVEFEVDLRKTNEGDKDGLIITKVTKAFGDYGN